MRHLLAFLAASAALLLGSAALAGEISPDLAAQLAATPPDAPVSVIVHLTEQAPMAALQAQLDQTRASRQERHGAIVSALQDAARGQAPLLADLAATKRAGGVLGYTSYWISNLIVVLAVPPEIEKIAARPDVAWVEPNFTASLIAPVNERPAGDGSEGALSRGIGMTPGVRAVRAPEVWRDFGIDGWGTLIGSCDTGVRGDHPALAARWRGTHAPSSACWLDVLGTGTTFPVDNNSHGTHTTGTMCGLAPDDTIGVAPGAQWIAANPIDQNTSPGFDSDVIASFQWFADPDGDPFTSDDVPDVVQNSWGVNENFSGYVDCDSRWWAAIDNCEAAGVVTTWSAGNEGSGAGTLRSPSDRALTIYNCFSVGAVDATSYPFPYPIAGFSSRGPSTCPGVIAPLNIKPEVSAPGVQVYSSVPTGYGYKDGTSMAGPHVAGVVALMRQANPDLAVDDVKRILMETARDLGAAGQDNTFGWGMIDAYAAVDAAMAGFGTLRGVITNASFNDLPLAGAIVEIPARGFRFRSGDDGAYHGRLAPGTHDVVVSLPGFAPQSRTVTIGSGETVLDVALVDVAGPTITGVSQPVATPDTAGPYTIAAQIADASTVVAATLHVRIGDGGWQELPMAGTRDAFAAAIAGQPANTSIHYYVTATDGAGFTTADPAGAPTTTYAMVITDPIYVHDVEAAGDPAWQLGASGDAADTGIWLRADPVGTVYNGAPLQTEDDHTLAPGTICYVTGNGAPGGGYSDQDVDHGCTTLITPSFDLTGHDRAFVTYWRWYAEAGNSTDDDFLVEASNDGGTTWVTLETVPTNQNAWQRVAVELGALAGGTFALTGDVRIRFLACDLNSQGLVEAAIDDFAIETFDEETSTAVGDDVLAVPSSLLLAPNQPNPFNPSTTIAFALPRAGAVNLAVYTLDGRRVAVLVDGTLPAGPHTAVWTGRDETGRQLASGTYFYRLTTGAGTLTKRMLMVK